MKLRLPDAVTWRLHSLLMRKVAHVRQPDLLIGGAAPDTYLRRWYVIRRNPVFNVYLHHVLRSDDDRALHDHPWFNLSVILLGAYDEHTIAAGGVQRLTRRTAGALKVRTPWAAHRLELIASPDGPLACWTLFITGPRMRSWGFHCPRGWVDWRDFTNPEDGGATVGRGCGEGS